MEVELKFAVDDDDADRVWQRARDLGLIRRKPASRQLVSTYYDTAGEALRHAGIALRLRSDGRAWLQTAKLKHTHHGALQRVHESEVRLERGELDLAAFADPALAGGIEQAAAGEPLTPVYETRMKRASTVLALEGGARVEVAVDRGEIRAGERRAAFSEVEFELVEGNLDALFDLAGQLMSGSPARFSRLSKAARGHLLASRGSIDPVPLPRNALTVDIARDWSTDKAARAILRECVDQIVSNVDTVRRSDDPEGPHQLRIGLRRLRSAFSIFAPVLKCPQLDRLQAEARWLGREAGALRDIDVVLHDIVEPAAADNPADQAMTALRDRLADHAITVRGSLRATLDAPRTQAFMFDLVRYVETRAWRKAGNGSRSSRMAAPVSRVARRELDRHDKAARRRARKLAGLDIEERHELRKELKKLRYATEFFAPLFSARKTRRFLKHMRRLQALFGDLNDAQMLRDLFETSTAGTFAPETERAIGWIIGASETRAAVAWQDAVAVWSSFKTTPRFWR